MGQFSVEKPVAPGSVLSGNQQALLRNDWLSVRKEALVSSSGAAQMRERPNRPFGFDRSGARPGEGPDRPDL